MLSYGVLCCLVLLLFQTRVQQYLILVAGHLGVKTPGDPATLEPSTTHSCESSRARKKNLLQKRADSEQVSVRYEGLAKVMFNSGKYRK